DERLAGRKAGGEGAEPPPVAAGQPEVGVDETGERDGDHPGRECRRGERADEHEKGRLAPEVAHPAPSRRRGLTLLRAEAYRGEQPGRRHEREDAARERAPCADGGRRRARGE